MQLLPKTAGLTLLCLLYCISAITYTKAIDCQKYIFAKKCRGISAKRALDGWGPPSESTSHRASSDDYYQQSADYSKEVGDRRMFQDLTARRGNSRTVSQYPGTDSRSSDYATQGNILRVLFRMFSDTTDDLDMI